MMYVGIRSIQVVSSVLGTLIDQAPSNTKNTKEFSSNSVYGANNKRLTQVT